ncbi:nucleotide exchange factor GrpE [Candidatus Pacearchaeota archaeon]|nr:nucleotide exchange factor GrpE [Candidatus Pacearchaeota archaeon]
MTEEKNYIEQLQRLQAEFDNFRKRIEKEKSYLVKNANENLIIKLLGILDNFELALEHLDDKGVNMIYSELYTVLENEGLKTIKAEGKFNPEFHEALIQEEGEEDEKIIEELLKGYTLNDKVIRPSKVKITKIMEKENE